jgi:hypothetical protein
MEESILLFVAAVALKTEARLGVLTSFGLACLIIYKGIEKLFDIARAEELSAWSVSAFRKWWSVGNGMWDFPRLLLAGFIVFYALITLLTRSSRRTGRETESQHNS